MASKEELFFETETLKHKKQVADLLMGFASELLRRAVEHDESKLEDPERETFIRVTPKLKSLTYGSKEYHDQIAELGPALKHHYDNNPHHPEHTEDVGMMTLLDITEMFCDWLAATYRHADGRKTAFAGNGIKAGLIH